MEHVLTRLSALYESYLETVNRLERERKLGEGMFGFGGGPANNPCHERFASDLAALLTELSDSDAPSALRREVLERIFMGPVQNPGPRSAYWMLLAVHGLTRDLINSLAPEDADTLLALYEKNYPRRALLPVQFEVLDLLRGTGTDPGQKPRRSFFRKQ